MLVPSPIGAVERVERVNENVWPFSTLLDSKNRKRCYRATIQGKEREGGAWDVNDIGLFTIIL
jgi:hypothetical protein